MKHLEQFFLGVVHRSRDLKTPPKWDWDQWGQCIVTALELCHLMSDRNIIHHAIFIDNWYYPCWDHCSGRVLLLIMTTGHCSLGGLPPARLCVARSGEGWWGRELSCPGVKVAYVELVAGWRWPVLSPAPALTAPTWRRSCSHWSSARSGPRVSRYTGHRVH